MDTLLEQSQPLSSLLGCHDPDRLAEQRVAIAVGVDLGQPVERYYVVGLEGEFNDLRGHARPLITASSIQWLEFIVRRAISQPFGGKGSFLPIVSVFRIWLLSLRWSRTSPPPLRLAKPTAASWACACVSYRPVALPAPARRPDCEILGSPSQESAAVVDVLAAVRWAIADAVHRVPSSKA